LRVPSRIWFWLTFVVMLPIALGPATSTIARTLGGAPQHTCACGMKRGTCGCPECAHLETARRDAKNAPRYVAIRSTCEDDDGFVRAPTIPAATPPNAPLVIATAPSIVREPTHVTPLDSQLAREPSTPPPRG
jgi:hypothetical protein